MSYAPINMCNRISGKEGASGICVILMEIHGGFADRWETKAGKWRSLLYIFCSMIR